MSDVNEININENYNQEIQGNQAEESRYVVAAGSNDEERQGLLDQISAYIDVISKAADNQFVTLSGDTKKEKMWQRTIQMVKSLGKKLEATDEELPKLDIEDITEEDLTSQKGKEAFLGKMDEFLLKIQREDDYVFDPLSKKVKKYTHIAENYKKSEWDFNKVKTVIEDKSYSWEERKKLLQSLHKIVSSSKVNTSSLPLVDKYLESEEKALDWLKALGKIAYNNIKTGDPSKIKNVLDLTEYLAIIADSKLETIHTTDIQNRLQAADEAAENEKNKIDSKYRNIIKQSSERAYKTVKDADPTLLISSKQYKNLRAATEKLNERFKEINDNREGDYLSETDMRELIDLAKAVDASSDAYTDYKRNSLGNKRPNKTEQSRINAAVDSKQMANTILKVIHNYTVEAAMVDGPANAISVLENRVQSGNVSERKLAEMLYLESLKKVYEANQDKEVLEVLLDYDKMTAGVEDFLKDPSFKAAADKLTIDKQGSDAQKEIYTLYLETRTRADQQKQNQRQNLPRQQHQMVNNRAPQIS